MQKSKKMMVSLCGLALSSLFVLNNKSVVHADTVTDGSQNNAISWDLDSDQAQGVQNADDDQQNTIQPMQSRAETSTVRSSSANRNTTVQDNTANAHATQDIKVANVDTAEPAVVKQSQAGYSETLSNLGSNANLGDLGVYDVSPDGVKSNIQSQVQRQLAINDASLANFNMNKDASGNLTASFGVYSNRAKQQNWWTNVKVNNTTVPGIQWRTNVSTASDGNLHLASTGQPIVYSVGIHKLAGAVIHNPANNQVHVHYVKTNGADVGVGDYDIYTNKNVTSGSYIVPKDYQLADQNEKYDINYQTHTVRHAAQYEKDYSQLTTGNKYVDAILKNRNMLKPEAGMLLTNSVDGDGWGLVIDDDDDLSYAQYEYEVHLRNEGGLVNAKLSDFNIYSTSTPNTHGGGAYYEDHNDGMPNENDIARFFINWSDDDDFRTKHWVVNGSVRNVEKKPAWNETVVDKTIFTDGSDMAKASGNTVDVVLTKPQSVNPAMDTRCQSQATRTIQINFPDGQVPKSYDGIVDKNGKLVQTVHFTRTATEDALTSTILSYGNWTSDNKDPNFIGFEQRTLPKIPGYTLSIKPA